MRNILIGTLLIVIVGLVLLPNHRWLVVNGFQAKSCAESLLNSDSSNCDRFNHMVVSSDSGMVSFSAHDSEVIYAYSPNMFPVSVNGVVWHNIYKSWFVGVTKT